MKGCVSRQLSPEAKGSTACLRGLRTAGAGDPVMQARHTCQLWRTTPVTTRRLVQLRGGPGSQWGHEAALEHVSAPHRLLHQPSLWLAVSPMETACLM
jgi:hypothetical protein